MDVESFMQATPPGTPRSVITPYAKDVKRLRSEGYTLGQIHEFLSANGVTVTIQSLSAWFKRHGKGAPAMKLTRDSEKSSSVRTAATTEYVPEGRLSHEDFTKYRRPRGEN